MLHNLKVFRCLATVHKFGGNKSAIISANRWDAHLLSRLSSTSTPATPTSIKCWQCGSSHSSNDGIQFQCTKCQSLLNLPSQVVQNAQLYANRLDQCVYDLLKFQFICRIISICSPLIASTKSIRLNCNRNSVKCKAFCIPINLVKSKMQLLTFYLFFVKN